jgi:hypothetical protein
MDEQCQAGSWPKASPRNPGPWPKLAHSPSHGMQLGTRMGGHHGHARRGGAAPVSEPGDKV